MSTDSAEMTKFAGAALDYTLAGLSLGGGVGLASALANYIKSLKAEEDMEDEALMDNDVLYLRAPGSKQANDEASIGSKALGITGGVLGAGAAYALVRKLYAAERKKKLVGMLEDAQRQTLDLADMESDLVNKVASGEEGSDVIYDAGGDGLVNNGLSAGGAALLLAALSSSALAYKGLQKAFPTVKKPVSDKPRAIRFLQDKAKEEVQEKAASERQHRDFCDAGQEYLVALTAAFPSEHNVTRDLICKSASGGLAEMEEQVSKAASVMEFLDSLPEGNLDAFTPAQRQMGVGSLIKSATLAPLVSHLASAEFNSLLPVSMQSWMAGRDEASMMKCAHIGSLLGMQERLNNMKGVIPEGYESIPNSEPADVKAALQSFLAA